MSPAPLGSDEQAEQPILWVGMTGFSPQQREFLEASLVRPPGYPRWQPSHFSDADVWWVNGAKVRLMPDGNLKVAAGLPTEHALNLNLSEVDRPVAFASPLASTDFEPKYAFDPASAPSIEAVLRQFESWLWLVRAQFTLGGQIIRRGAALRYGVYHVHQGGRLLAVLDFRQGKVAIKPRAHPVDLLQAEWDSRPIGAGGLPESFSHLTLEHLTWTYVRRSDRNMLPERYRSRLIHYRRPPGVPLRWLRDSQLILLRELFAEPGTMESLLHNTGLPAGQVERDLACLYYAGAVTTTSAKAAALSARQDSGPYSVGPALDSMVSIAGQSEHQYGLTAPVQLEATRTPSPTRASNDGGTGH
jgi:hypothetical protein